MRASAGEAVAPTIVSGRENAKRRRPPPTFTYPPGRAHSTSDRDVRTRRQRSGVRLLVVKNSIRAGNPPPLPFNTPK